MKWLGVMITPTSHTTEGTMLIYGIELVSKFMHKNEVNCLDLASLTYYKFSKATLFLEYKYVHMNMHEVKSETVSANFDDKGGSTTLFHDENETIIKIFDVM